MRDFYKNETSDFELVQGDSKYLRFKFRDLDSGNKKNILSYSSKFNIRNPVTDDILTDLEKTHNDVAPKGGGIYYLGDSNVVSGINITENNQIVIFLTAVDTSVLQPGAYPFDIEFTSGTFKQTVVKGNLIISREVTPSV